ncbi:MAG: hypothetical protein OXU20_31220 [Myxococcales bacterium]|nr:hypothetical protein [Myxococcales bacterium]
MKTDAANSKLQAYFERAAPFRIIVASFVLIFVPLTALLLVPNYYEWVPYLVVLEVVGLGVTHFFITLAVYLQRDTLRYFNSTAKNRLIYFVAPPLILFALALLPAINAEAKYPLFTLYLFRAVRLADFFHVGRQSYGMLQIWKRQAGDAIPRWHRSGENAFFVGMAFLQWRTSNQGGYFANQDPISTMLALGLLGLFLALAVGYLTAMGRGGGTSMLRPLMYLTMQAACAASAAYQTRLYLTALALHYVEYHMIMGPRCFYTPLDTRHRVDRANAFLRGHMIFFYALLLLVVVVFEARNHVTAPLTPTTSFFVHIFDGIFLLHYFIEAFLWRFRIPHYRETLLPLYMRPWAEIRREAKESPNPPAAGSRSALPALGVILIALLIAHTQGALASAGAYLTRTLGKPAYAQNQFEFGLSLARAGELGRAREHLQVSLEHEPNSPQTRMLLQEVDEHLRARGGSASPP